MQLCYVSGSSSFAFVLALSRPSSVLNFPASSLSVGFRLIRISPRQMEIVFELAACRILKNSAFATNPIKISFFLSSLIPIGSQTTSRVPGSGDIRFALVAIKDASASVSATIQLRFRDFSKMDSYWF